MKAAIRESSEMECVIQVEIPAEVVDRKLEEVYRRVVRTLEIPGFRRGHIPRSFLEMRFGKDFLYEDARAELIEAHLPKALEELKVQPASRPEPKIVEFEAGKPFRFEVVVEVFPEVELADYSAIEVEAPPKSQVTQEEIEHEISELQGQHATVVPRPKDSAVEPEDVVVIRERDGTIRELQVHPQGWTAALLGKRIGEAVELDSPEGQRRKVSIDGIKRIELPDVEELAKTLGHESQEALREDLKRRLEESLEQEYEQKLRWAVLDALVAKSKVKVPPRLVEQLLEQEKEYLKRSGQEPKEEVLTKLKEVIERRLKRERVLQALKQKENITLSEEEFEEFIKRESARRGTDPLRLKALLEREGHLERVRQDQEDQKVLDLLMKRAHFRSKQKEG